VNAENLRAHGLIDAVVPPGELAAFLGRLLTAMTAEPDRAARPEPAGIAVSRSGPAWASVLRSREADRPGACDLIRLAATDVVPLRRAGLIVALARIGGCPCVLVADGIVDLVIPEPPGDGERLCRDLGGALHLALRDLAHQDDDTRLAARLRRYRHLGVPPHHRGPKYPL